MISVPRSPRFSGGFKKFTVGKFTNYEQGTESRLLVYSQGSRAKVAEKLWLKFLWDELTKKEFELFLLLPEIVGSEIKQSALRAVLILPKRVVRERVNKWESFFGLTQSSKERYQGFKRLDVEIHDFTRRLPKVTKYSGYVASPSSVGSKRSLGYSSEILESTEFIEEILNSENNVLDWYRLLTVAENDPFQGTHLDRPDEDLKSETV